MLTGLPAITCPNVVINGLAIINENPSPGAFSHVQPPEGLPEYYRRNVTGGLGSFLIVVEDFDSFADGITIDLSATRAVDSAGLGALMLVQRKAALIIAATVCLDEMAGH